MSWKVKRSYTLPSDLVDLEPLRKEAARRREALRTAGCSKEFHDERREEEQS
jgi:hypothetical protein